MLTSIALDDSDPDVRTFAEKKIASLRQDYGAIAIQPLMKELESPVKQSQAYALLGRLRNAGLKFKLPRMRLLSRIHLAKSASTEFYPHRNVHFWLRAWRSVGASVGLSTAFLALFCAGFLNARLEPWSIVGYAILGGLLGLLLSSLATIFTSPAGLQADPAAAMLLDMSVVVASVFALTAVTVLLHSAASGAHDNPTEIPDDLVLLVATALTAIAVRAGTQAAFGVVRMPKLNWVLQTLTGGLGGIAVFEIVLISTRRSATDLLAASWTMLASVTFALAAAYAGIDGQSALRPVTKGWGRVPGFLLAAVGALIYLVLSRPLPPAESIQIDLIGKHSFEIKQVPQEYTFTIQQEYTCVATVEGSYKVLAYSGVRSSSKGLVIQSYNTKVPPDTNRLVVGFDTSDNTSFFDAMQELAKHFTMEDLGSRLMYRRPIRAQKVTDLNLNCAPSSEAPKPTSPSRPAPKLK